MHPIIACYSCKYFNRKKGNICKAFPEGIPESIINGSNMHKELLKSQDNKIIWEKGDK